MAKMFKTLAVLAILGFGLAVLTGCPAEIADTPTVRVTCETAEVIGGGTCKFEAIIRALPEGIDDTIIWSIEERGIHGGTFIDEKGLLTIASAEKQSRLTIRAALLVDPSIYGQTVITVSSPEPVITGLKLTASSLTGLTGKSVLFSVSVEGKHNPPLHMNWEIVTAGHHADTTLIGGLLTIAVNEPKTEITVRATSIFDPEFSAEETINIAVLPAAMKIVAPGGSHTAAIGNDGSLWAWGSNMFGQIGDNTTGNQRLGFSRIGTNNDWVSVSAGSEHTTGIRADGSLWAWGNNADGRTGLNTDSGNTAAPARVGTAADWVSVSAGNSHTLAIKTDGTLWAWGNNANGMTGIGTDTGTANGPVQVGTNNDWVCISAGVEHSMGIREDNQSNRTLWAWGNGANGKLGTGNADNQNTPTQSGNADNWATVSAGNIHSMGIRTDGTLYAVGSTAGGLFGGGWSSGAASNWMQVGSLTTWSSVCAGLTYTMASRTDGTLWATGSTNNGQLGGGWGVGQQTNSFLQVGASLAPWESVSTGSRHTLAIRADGTLWAWGANSEGQLGDGMTFDRLSPFQIVP